MVMKYQIPGALHRSSKEALLRCGVVKIAEDYGLPQNEWFALLSIAVFENSQTPMTEERLHEIIAAGLG